MVALIFIKTKNPQWVWHLRRYLNRKRNSQWSGRCLKLIMGIWFTSRGILLNCFRLVSQQTLTEHIEYNEVSSSDVVQNMQIGERGCQSICHNYIFNLKWLNEIMISSPSMMPILLRIINKKVKCYQLIN